MPDTPRLEIEDLHVSVNGRPILKGLTLTVRGGEIHALMGPNGSGKTTLSFTLMGHPRYRVERGAIRLDGVDLTGLPPDARARAGLFLAFQYPTEVPGVTMTSFLRQAVNAVRGEELSAWEFREVLLEKLALLEMDESFARRYLNEGFSGGEKKRAETLQMLLLKPKIAVLDEPDSGLDVDAIRVVARGINAMRGPEFGALIITHYNRILQHVVPDAVHVLMDGRIVRSGGPELALDLERRGYDWLREAAGGEQGHGPQGGRAGAAVQAAAGFPAGAGGE